MVYPGHPSTGCIQCKARRVKCDATRPKCLRCAKYGLLCPGYPQRAFVFQDVTDRTQKNASRSYVKRRSKIWGKQLLSDNSGESGPMALPTGQHMVYTAELTKPALLQAATAAFLSRCDVHISGVFQDPPILYSSNIQPFTAALEAFSLMTLCVQRDTQTYDVRRTAMRQYSISLKSINNCLCDTRQSLTDTTILAVYLIALIEVYVDQSGFQLKAQTGNTQQTAHVNLGQYSLAHFLGILNIIKARGVGQLDTFTGRQLLLAVALIWHGMVMPIPWPIAFPINDELCNQLTTFIHDRNAVSYRLVPLFNRNTILRRDALSMLGQAHVVPLTAESISGLLAHLESLDQSFADWWQQSLPETWSQTNEIDQFLSKNLVRVYHIFAEDLRVRCLRILAMMDGKIRRMEIISSAIKARQAVDEICATMPYDFTPDDPSARAPHVHRIAVPSVESDLVSHLAFSFPLLVTTMVDAGIPKAQREGIKRARRACSQSVGIADPVRNFPRVLVEMGPYQHEILRCPRCGSEHHYDGQICGESVASAEERELIRQNKVGLGRLEKGR